MVPAPFLLNFCHWYESWLRSSNWTSQSAKDTFLSLLNIRKMGSIYLDLEQIHSEVEIIIKLNDVTFATRDYRVCDICISLARALNYSLMMSTNKFTVDKCLINCYERPLLIFDSEIFKQKYFFLDVNVSANDDTTIDIMNVLIAEQIIPRPNLILNSSK